LGEYIGLNFNGLDNIISQMIELFITTAVRASNLAGIFLFEFWSTETYGEL
jgi:hypothetical protein